METKSWVCDSCGEKIENQQDGWVEWLHKTNYQGAQHSCRGIRIVHRINCIYDQDAVFKNENAIAGDSDLESFMGPDGLMQLLSFISEDKFEDTEEVLEIIKRIHIPGYEEARFCFDEAISQCVFEPNTQPNYYDQKDIVRVLDYAQRKNK
ncbi:MAG: hypothetical protein PHE79_04180 [Eubacteriales bacterium]|nr:hypothetical protein [Eubacteriales bacterium]